MNSSVRIGRNLSITSCALCAVFVVPISLFRLAGISGVDILFFWSCFFLFLQGRRLFRLVPTLFYHTFLFVSLDTILYIVFYLYVL